MRSQSSALTAGGPVWDWGLFFSIFLMLVLPAIYQSYSIYLVGNKPPGDQMLAIVAQWQFVQVGMEVIQEGLVLPLFYLVGQVRSLSPAAIVRRLQATGTMVVIVLVPVFVLAWLCVPLLVEHVDTATSLQAATEHYLRIRVAALFWGILNIGLFIVLESLRLRRLLVVIVLLKLVLSVGADSLFYGDYTFSLGWGAAGVAWSSFAVEGAVFVLMLLFLSNHFGPELRQNIRWPEKIDWQNFRRISGWIFLESFVRNLAYFFLILKLINSIGPQEIAAYYLCMHLLWSFALLPVLAIADTSKVLLANAFPALPRARNILKAALLRTLGVLFLWLVCWFFVEPIIAFFSADESLNALALQALHYLLPAYALLALNLTLSSVFLGSGQTQYLAYKSLLTNGLVYGAAYVAYLTGGWVPTFTGVLLLFALGIVVGTGLTVWYVGRVISRPDDSGLVF